ncbi:vitellogenin-2-like [Dermacentor silvarum]|uniref:vitellogenin-2-like n=1 Tax=Dermacentor silvarum TaxID=543639 RepID=UPI002101A0ED|nr:vitellogenin-2-like [Dermacentor silvarum]
MRVLAALALLVAAVAALEVPYSVPKLVFEPRQEYLYKYRTTVALSVPQKASHATGEEVYGYLKISVTAADPVAKTARLFVQLLNVTTSVFDKEVHDHTEAVPGLYHTPLEQYLHLFEKPVVFTVEQLKVTAIEAPEDLPEPVVNLYRGLASVLTFSEPLTHAVPFSKVTPVSPDDEVVVYKVFEHDLVGNCETTYHVLSDVHDFSVLNLTKSKNYHKCLGHTSVFHHADYEYQGCPQTCQVHKPVTVFEGVEPEFTQYNDPYGAGCVKEFYDKNDLGDSFLTVKYNVSVLGEYGLLETVKAVDKKVLVSGKQQLVATSVLALELLYKKSAISVFDETTVHARTYSNLTYAYPEQHYVSHGPALELEHLSLWGPIDRKEAMVAVRALVSRLAELVALDDLEVKDDYADLIVQLLTVVNALPQEDLELLLKTVVSIEKVNEVSEKEYIERKLLLDALSLGGTDATAKTVLTLLKEEKLTLVESVHVLTALQTSLAKPSTEVLDELLDLCVSDKFTEERLLFSTSCLALAKAVRKHCTHHDYPVSTYTNLKQKAMMRNIMKIRSKHHSSSEEFDDEVTPEYKELPQYDTSVSCSLQDYEKYVQAVVSKLEQSKEFHVVAVLLHTLAKLEHPLALKAVVPFVLGKHPLCKVTLGTEDESEACQYLRLVTLHALKHSAVTQAALVQPVLQTVYFDKDEDYELRAVALSLLLLTHPPEPVLARVVLELPREKSLQVASYTYHALLAFSNHTLPCYKPTVHHLKKLLPALTHHKYGFQYSTFNYVTGYTVESGVGLQGYLGVVKGNNSFLPRSVFYGLDFTKGPYSSPLLDVTVVSKGLQNVHKLLLGEDGPLSLLASAFQRVRRGLRMNLADTYTPLTVLLDVLDQHFNFDTETVVEEPKLVLDTKFLGTDLFLPLDKYFVKELLTKGAEYVKEKWVHPVNFRYVQLRVPYTYRKVVPTVVGYPVAMTTRYPTIVSLSLKDLKVRYQPNPKTLVPSIFAVSALVQPTVYSTAVTSTVTVTPFTKLVAAVRVIEKTRFTQPHDLALQFSGVNHTLAFTFRPRFTKLFTHETKTMTYTTPAFFFTAPQRSVLATMSVLATQSKPFEYKKVLGHKYVGVGLEVTGLTAEPTKTPLLLLAKRKELVKSLLEVVLNPWAVSRKWEARLVRNPQTPVDEYKVVLRLSTTLNGTDPADYVKEVKPLYRTQAHYPSVRHTYPEDLKTPVYEELFVKATGFLPPDLDHYEVLHKVVEASKVASYPKADNVKPLLQNVTNTTYAYGVEFVVSALGPMVPKAVYGHFVYGTSFDKTLKLYQLYANKVESDYEAVVNSVLLKSPRPSPFTTFATKKEAQYLYGTSTAELFSTRYGPLKYSVELEATPSAEQLETYPLMIVDGVMKKLQTKRPRMIQSSLWEREPEDVDYSYRRKNPRYEEYEESKPYAGVMENIGAYSVPVSELPWYYTKCQEDIELGKELVSYACKKVHLHEHRLDKFVLKVTLPTQYPSLALNVTHKLFQTAKVLFYDKSTTEYVESPAVTEGQFLVEAVLEDLYTGVTTANVTVHTPHFEKVTFTRMPWLKLLRPTVAYDLTTQLLAVARKGYPFPTCMVSPYYLKTFDNVTLPLETLKKQVPHVLLRHAVDDPEFYVVLEQKSEDATALQVVLKNQTLVKLTPPKDQTTYEVEVNGTLLTVDPLQSHVLQYYHNYSSQVLLYVTVHHEVAPTLWLKVRDSGLLLAYNGSSVIVSVKKPKYTGTLVGLCGDNNKESQYEYVTPEKCVVTEVEDFLNSYSLEPETVLKGHIFCPAGVTPKFGTPVYGGRYNSTSYNSTWYNSTRYNHTRYNSTRYNNTRYNSTKISKISKISKIRGQKVYKDDDVYDEVVAQVTNPECMTERRKVVYEGGKVCISLNKVTACKRGCKPSKTEPRELEFTCLDKENSKLKKMLKDIQSKRELPMSLTDIPTITKTVDVPVDCVTK